MSNEYVPPHTIEAVKDRVLQQTPIYLVPCVLEAFEKAFPELKKEEDKK